MADTRASLTVIIPTYNRAEILEKCLESLAKQTLPLDAFQVVVADDGSRDDTRKRAERFLKDVFPKMRYLWQENSGQNAARNRAIQESEGDILLFINDDTIATPTLVEQHKAFHDLNPASHLAMLGRITISPEIPPTVFAKLHLDAAFAQWHEKKELDWHAFYTCNVSVKKAFLLEYGLFDESLRYNDDLELALRLSRHGFKIFYDPEALGYHYHYLTEKSYTDLAKLSGKTLAVWYKNAPHLEQELASIGFYLTTPFLARVKYFLGDMIVNEATIPLILRCARRFADTHQALALTLYQKVYRALERKNIREEMKRT